MELKEYRKSLKISAKEAAKIVGVPFRTYQRYEENENHGDSIKRETIIKSLNNAFEINEEKGLLTIESITKIVNEVFSNYDSKINICYLFGSYAKGYATEKSDVDLCIDTEITGLEYVGLVGRLNEALHKKIDLVRLNSLTDNLDLIKEILKNGKKIYG